MNSYRLAHTYRLLGRYDEAISILKKVRESNQDETSALYDLGINYQSMGNQKEAKKYYSGFRKIALEDWLKTYPNMPETYIAIGAIAARMSDFEASGKALQKAMEIDSTRHEKFAEVLCLQGKIHEALDEIEKALEKGYRDIVWLKINPDYQALQKEVRFQSLLHKYFE